MHEVARGEAVFVAPPVVGRWRLLAGPDDVLALMDAPGGAEGIVAFVHEAGATFLAPLYHELAAVVCASGTSRSHVGIVSREYQVPCIMGVVFDGGEPADEAEVEVDCSGPEGVLRA